MKNIAFLTIIMAGLLLSGCSVTSGHITYNYPQGQAKYVYKSKFEKPYSTLIRTQKGAKKIKTTITGMAEHLSINEDGSRIAVVTSNWEEYMCERQQLDQKFCNSNPFSVHILNSNDLSEIYRWDMNDCDTFRIYLSNFTPDPNKFTLFCSVIDRSCCSECKYQFSMYMIYVNDIKTGRILDKSCVCYLPQDSEDFFRIGVDYDIKISPDEKYLVLYSGYRVDTFWTKFYYYFYDNDGLILVWDTDTHQLVRIKKGLFAPVYGEESRIKWKKIDGCWAIELPDESIVELNLK